MTKMKMLVVTMLLNNDDDQKKQIFTGLRVCSLPLQIVCFVKLKPPEIVSITSSYLLSPFTLSVFILS